MLQVHFFSMNMFQENSYILYDSSKDCVLIDPGCYYKHERQRLARFIEERKLRPVALLNTHCHLDHVFGNAWAAKTYDLKLYAHLGELPVLESLLPVAQAYGIPNVEASPEISVSVEEGQVLEFGKDMRFRVLFTPGHSPASVCFYQEEQGVLISGDVLFENSIGRSDLPGGNHNRLMQSIKEELLVLDDTVQVFPGHGPATTIGRERLNNPFLRS